MTLTLEDIEALEKHCQNNGAVTVGAQNMLDYCTLAKRGLETMPRPCTANFDVMYDNHTFKSLKARTAEDAVKEWVTLFTPFKSGIGGDPSLCPVTLTDAAGAECRPRAGEMLHTPHDQKAVSEWIRVVTTALETP